MQQNELAAILGIVMVVLCGFLVVVLILSIFYFLTLQKALNRCAPHNRRMEPAMVWLGIVPCVSLVWQFFIATQVPESLKNEFRERGRDDGSDYGRSIAMTQAVLTVINIFVSQGSSFARHQAPEASLVASGISGIISIVCLALLIVFWVKIAGYSSKLGDDRGGDLDRKLREFDDDDDFGRPRPSGTTPPSEGIKEGDPGQIQ